jgi:hypothetical protein
MKKYLTAFMALTITVLAFYSCNLIKALDEVKKAGFYCSNYSYSPVNEMDKYEVLDMIRTYYNNQYNNINSHIGPSTFDFNNPALPSSKLVVDSRAVFFDLDTLKKLIYYMDKASENFPLADKQNLGVNVYFAAYPQYFNKEKHGWDYKNRHTLIFFPSIFNNVSHIAQDIDLMASLSGTTPNAPTYITEAFLSDSSMARFVVLTDGNSNSSSMMSQNNGTAIPPPPTPTGNAILDKTDPF